MQTTQIIGHVMVPKEYKVFLEDGTLDLVKTTKAAIQMVRSGNRGDAQFDVLHQWQWDETEPESSDIEASNRVLQCYTEMVRSIDGDPIHVHAVSTKGDSPMIIAMSAEYEDGTAHIVSYSGRM